MQNSFITPNAGEFISVKGLRLHYVSLGAGRAVMLLHGNAGFAQDFSLVMPALAEKGFRAIAFDRPGHGESERPVNEEATVALQADLIREALSELRVEKPILVGHSWGALVVLQYALHFPGEVSGLVLLAPAVYPDEEQFGFEKSLIEIPRIGNLILKMSSPFIDKEIRSNLVRAFAPDEVPADYLELATTVWNRPQQIKAVIQDEAIYNPTVKSLSARYDKIQTETIIVTGDSDMEVDPEKHAIPLHWEIAHSELRVLPATGHMIPHTRPRAVLDAIESIKTHIS
ncbi:MAG TPA: alpha/beta hydrolase [Pyrinomonadaceae bacterium]